MPTVAITGQTTFGANTSGTTTQLDNNFLLAYNALNNFQQPSNYLVDSGAADAYVVTAPASTTLALAAGLPLQIKIANSNTGAATLNANATGAKNVVNPTGSAVNAGQLIAGAIASVIYDGTNYVLIGGASAPTGANIVLGTPVAATSGTSIDFTGLPAGIKRITINLIDVSFNNTNQIRFQIGDSGGIETTGYAGWQSFLGAASTSGGVLGGGGFDGAAGYAATDVYQGQVVLCLENSSSNTWTCTFSLATTGTNNTLLLMSGRKSTSATLDRVRITTVAATAAFDAGEINIMYE